MNRSAVVLLTAVWEGFVEYEAAQALERLVGADTRRPDDLPPRLRQHRGQRGKGGSAPARRVEASLARATCLLGAWQTVPLLQRTRASRVTSAAAGGPYLRMSMLDVGVLRRIGQGCC